MRSSYSYTKAACYLGYVTQAIVNNFAPMLFVLFRAELGLSYVQVTSLVTLNFGIQLLVDLLSSFVIERIGYRPCIAAAHIFCALGLSCMAVLPFVLPAYAGLLLSVCIYSVGGGLIEVLISPIIEACPAQNKAAQMTFLHSFYCWGTAAVVSVTTLVFALFGTGAWRYAALGWAALPLLNFALFCIVPIPTLEEAGESGMRPRELLRAGTFWILALLIFASGAAELAMSQWASSLAESGLGVSKALGDLMGPCLFAVAMGVSRLVSVRITARVRLESWLAASGGLCVLSYLIVAFSPLPALALAGCVLCGFSVGAMWPGVFSLAAQRLPRGGISMFALLALAGDLGCTAGPTAVGFVAGALSDDLQTALLISVVFPLLIVLLLVLPRIAQWHGRGKMLHRQ